jgi:hypothetical protein
MGPLRFSVDRLLSLLFFGLYKRVFFGTVWAGSRATRLEWEMLFISNPDDYVLWAVGRFDVSMANMPSTSTSS